ncbi:MAG: hypothetical protein IT576_00990 [Verrucomicrobiales bacterium]|nr:hypothetical protein [Verrucomicrobiales bacterium]
MVSRSLLTVTLGACLNSVAGPAPGESEPLILAHFIPWYGSKDSSG